MSNLVYKPEIHEYFIDGVKLPGVTSILKSAGLTDMSGIKSGILIRAQKFGTALHKATELWDKGVLDMSSLSAPLIPYLEAWKKFHKDYQIEWGSVELPVSSVKYRFAGTLDRVGTIGGKNTIIDLKTSSVMYPAGAIQTAGYQIAYEEMTGEKIRQRWGVQLTPENTIPYKIENYTESSDKAVFLSALMVHNFKEKHNLIKKEMKDARNN